MPKGPKGEKRPADVIGAAVMVARIATGDTTAARPNIRRTESPDIPQVAASGLRSVRFVWS